MHEIDTEQYHTKPKHTPRDGQIRQKKPKEQTDRHTDSQPDGQTDKDRKRQTETDIKRHNKNRERRTGRHSDRQTYDMRAGTHATSQRQAGNFGDGYTDMQTDRSWRKARSQAPRTHTGR